MYGALHPQSINWCPVANKLFQGPDCGGGSSKYWSLFFLIAEPDSPPKNDWISVWNCLAAFSKKFLNFQYRIIPDSRATGYSADFCHVHGRGGRGVPYINGYGLHDCHDCSAPWLYYQRKAKNAQSGPWKLNMMVFNRDIDLRPFLTKDTDSLPQNW